MSTSMLRKIRRRASLICMVLSVITLFGCKKPSLSLSNDRFGTIEVQSGSTHPLQSILFFTDDSIEATNLRDRLLKEKFLVATIRTAPYLKSISQDGGECSYIGGEIERLSQTAQSELNVRTYQKPILVGYGTGATLAFSILAETPSTFRGAVTVSFCPELPIPLPLCPGDALVSNKISESAAITVGPSDILSSEWIDFEFQTNKLCPEASISALIKKTPNAQLIPSELSASDGVRDDTWQERFIDSVKAIGASEEQTDPNSPLPDLPLVISAPQQITTSYFVLFFSGDGGWAWIDKGITKVLNQHGIPVVGVNCLKYMWEKQSPSSIASDIKKIVKTYTKIFNVQGVSLMGYSLGAEVLPAAYNALSRGTKEKVVSIGMIAPGTASSYEVLIGDWLGVNDDEGEALIAPELKKIADIPVACIAGDDDEEGSVCKDVEQENLRKLLLTGGHHFDGNYEEVGEQLLSLLSPRS